MLIGSFLPRISFDLGTWPTVLVAEASREPPAVLLTASRKPTAVLVADASREPPAVLVADASREPTAALVASRELLRARSDCKLRARLCDVPVAAAFCDAILPDFAPEARAGRATLGKKGNRGALGGIRRCFAGASGK